MKSIVLNKKLKKRSVKKKKHVQIRFNDRNIDGIDRFHQHIQSLHDPKPLSGSSFHSVLFGSFVLFYKHVFLLLLCLILIQTFSSLSEDA